MKLTPFPPSNVLLMKNQPKKKKKQMKSKQNKTNHKKGPLAKIRIFLGDHLSLIYE